MSKLPKEQIEAIKYSCLDENTKTSENIIEYFDEVFEQQDKDMKIDRILSIVAIIISLIALFKQ